VGPDRDALPAEADWRRIHAFGLPSGSVRALLALLVFGTAWLILALRPSQEVPDFLRDLLFIILGHYFAARRAAVPGDEAGPPPLFLPRGSVRLVLVLGTAAVLFLLLRRGQLTDPDRNPGLFTLLLVGGFLLGVGLNAAFARWRARGFRPPRLIEDLRAVISLAAAVLLVALVLTRVFHLVPRVSLDAVFPGWFRLSRYGPEHVLAAIVGFYFGSRS
jgi:hypothetical protein